MKKTVTVLLACVLAFLLSSCSILPPKLWTDEEVLDRLCRYYGEEFEILTVEQEKSENFFTDSLIKGKKYTMSPMSNPDIVIDVTSEVTNSRGLFPGYDYYFHDNYTTLMFYNELERFLKSSNIPCDIEGETTIFLDKKNMEEIVGEVAEFINELGENTPFNSKGAWYSRAAASISFVYEQEGIKVDIIDYPFHFESQEKLPYLYMDADEVLSRLSEEIVAATETER